MNNDLPPLDSDLSTLEKLYSETALLAWSELQRFFAQGVVIWVSDSLDLVETAVLFADDRADVITKLLDENSVSYPSNDQARAWYDSNADLWSVVVAPYVLVQDQKIGDVH